MENMYCTVKLIDSPVKSLTYAVPEELVDQVTIGSIVQVPLRARVARGLICATMDECGPQLFNIRMIHSVEKIPYDAHYHEFIQQLSAYHAIEPQILYRRLHASTSNKKKKIIEM